jgi:hypothetical protein
MLGFIKKNIRSIVTVLLVLLAVGAVGYIFYGCGARSRDDEVAEIATRLAANETTLEIQRGLYATKIVEMGDLTKLLDDTRDEVKALKKQIDASQAQLLTTQQLVVKWKKAFEGAVNAHQSEPEPGRKRVDFEKGFGPIGVTGFTLTDPAEGFVSVQQLRPLKLVVAVARNRDGTWASYVTSSEPDMAVDVTLGGVDVGVLSLGWRQRIWIDAGVDFVAGRRVSLGASYRFDRVSLGAACSVWEDGQGCGLTAGFRPFK